MNSAFGIDHGEISKSWTKNFPKVKRAAEKLSTQRNPDQRKTRYLSNRSYISSHGEPLKPNSPATRAKKEMKVLGEGRSVSDGADASISMPLKPRKNGPKGRLP